jgi:hypothetical protein
LVSHSSSRAARSRGGRGSASLIVLVCVYGLACTRLPAPDVRVLDGAVEIDVQFLGEYPSPVARIRLTEVSSGSLIWEVVQQGPQPAEMRRLVLAEGANLASPVVEGGERFDVVTPSSEHFRLERGTRYRITLWGSRRSVGRSATFIIGNDSS